MTWLSFVWVRTMPGTVLSTLRALFSVSRVLFNPRNNASRQVYSFTFLWMRKMRLREVYWLAQGQIVNLR